MNPASRESQMENLLKNLPPNIGPRLEKRLLSAPWTPRGVKRGQALTLIYWTIILLIAFIGLTPQGRAFAQTIFEFFTTTDQSSFPLSKDELDMFYTSDPPRALTLIEVTPLSPTSDHCSNPEDAGTYECEIKRVENELNFDIKEFSAVPPGFTFAEIRLYQSLSNTNARKMVGVGISYQTSGANLSLAQGIGDFPLDVEKVLSSAVQPVKIGEYDGEYVNGGFWLRNGDTELTWMSTGADQRIRWREGERWFEILAFSGPGTSGYLDRQALISLASNMVYQPENSEKTTKVDFDFIPNLPLAEKIFGFDILQPTKLPQDMEFDFAKYDPERKSITLNYGYRALRIVQTPVESALIKNLDSYKNVEAIRVGDAVGQYGVSPAQKTIWESATPPVFTTNNSYSLLMWEKNGMVYQIYFDQSFSGGGYLTKDQMIEIAESLR